MTKTKVVHCKKEPYDILIDRTTKYGNPFVIGRNGTRKEVIEKCRGYILERKDLVEILQELRGKVLACWCKPLACHGDIYVELIDAMVQKEKKL